MSGAITFVVGTGAASPDPAGNCRICGDPSWAQDDSGPVHVCCSRLEPGDRCPACLTARTLRGKK